MRNLLAAAVLFVAVIQLSAKDLSLKSPDGTLSAVLNTTDRVSLEIFREGNPLFSVGDIFLKTADGSIPAEGSRPVSVKRIQVDNIIEPLVKENRARIADKYNEAEFSFSDKTKIIVRLYDDGVAYRIVSDRDGELVIYDEPVRFNFNPASSFISQQIGYNSYEAPYIETTVAEVVEGVTCNLPALVKLPSGENVVFLESDTESYPVMWLRKEGEGFSTHFWKYPRTYNTEGDYYERMGVTSYEDFIAETSARREFPWRAFAITADDASLIGNDLVYKLAPECRIENPSWIEPGWVTFDWWARRGLYGVDFKAGINTPTAKFMIDFASDYGLRYFLLDDGWTKDDDLTQYIDGLDIPEVVRYAGSKGVDVMLWVPFSLLDAQMDKALATFEKWGVKGIKIDFMDRDDQLITDFYWRAARKAAEHKMVIDFHGAYRPDGLRRAYPNVLTREALIEFEYNGWTEFDSPRHHCLLPFLRCVAGPADYIPGTTNNATKALFRNNGETPMGQGTRTHAMAMAVVVQSPMQMLSDPQTDYIREHECSSFLVNIPVEWDETVPLDCKLGEYVSVARKNGSDWYVSAITNWDPREMKISLGFLDKGKRYRMEYFRDGINADTKAIDYVHDFKVVDADTVIDASLVSGGGWLARIVEL